jgi:hypothetical protein
VRSDADIVVVSAGEGVFCLYPGQITLVIELKNLSRRYQPTPLLGFKDDCLILGYAI